MVMSYNLSDKRPDAEIDVKNILSWFESEIKNQEDQLQEIMKILFRNIDKFCKYPIKALLLWEDCDRIPQLGKKIKYHIYPDSIKTKAKEECISLDARPNGPAIAAFTFARGERPERYGSRNKWHIHHLYSGKFPYAIKENTLHAVKNGLHFTQSAGLVALHPLADALVDECPAFAWFLRYKSYDKFGYDPDNVFSKKIDYYGFDIEKKGKIEILETRDNRGQSINTEKGDAI